MTGEQQTGIDWKKFETDYVQLETGKRKALKLTNWQQGSWFNKPGLGFDVLEEDSRPVSKTFTTTSRQIIRALKPIIKMAEEQGYREISVSILRIGEGLNTLYELKNAKDHLPAQMD